MPVTAGLQGIDVSSNQGQVDWDAVSRENLSFAYIRATVGADTDDTQFAGNWMRIRETSLIRGAYHFFWPPAASSDQADHYVRRVGRLMAGDLPPALDLEEAHLSTNPQQDLWTTVPPGNRLPMILDWLTRVEHALGLKPIIYSRQNFLDNLLGDQVAALASHPLWIAHYTDAAAPQIPSAWSNWAFWQFTNKGSVPGVQGDVDHDCFNGSLHDLKKLTKTWW